MKVKPRYCGGKYMKYINFLTLLIIDKRMRDIIVDIWKITKEIIQNKVENSYSVCNLLAILSLNELDVNYIAKSVDRFLYIDTEGISDNLFYYLLQNKIIFVNSAENTLMYSIKKIPLFIIRRQVERHPINYNVLFPAVMNEDITQEFLCKLDEAYLNKDDSYKLEYHHYLNDWIRLSIIYSSEDEAFIIGAPWKDIVSRKLLRDIEARVSSEYIDSKLYLHKSSDLEIYLKMKD